MLVKEAKRIARQWIETESGKTPGFVGAFIAGSVNWMPDDAPLPQTSDFDLEIIIDGAEVPPTFGKTTYNGLLIEPGYTPLEHVRSPEIVLSRYPIAAHFTRPCILSDPTGHLSNIQAVVKTDFARRKWVQARVDDAANWQLTSLGHLDTSAPLHEQVFAWAYSASIFSHILLVADLKNPTVRKMQIASRDVLARYEQLSFHDQILEHFGTASLTARQVTGLLENFREVFEAAQGIEKTDFLTYMISAESRPTILGGIAEMIEAGYPGEAAFWLLCMHSMSQKLIHNGAPPDIQARFLPRYDELIHSIGIHTPDDVQRRAEQVQALNPQAIAIAAHIMSRNTNIIS